MQSPPVAPHAAPDHDTAEVRVRRGQSLDQWLAHSWSGGVQTDELEDLETLRVETRNSSYELAIVSRGTGHVIVRGGRYFPEWTPVYLLGCSLGGGLLKRHAVHPGLRMELSWAGRRIVTSPVHAIGRNGASRPSAAC